MKIKNLLFDLGGVIATLHEDITASILSSCGMTTEWWAQNGDAMILKLNRGEINGEEFCAELAKACNPGTSLDTIRIAYESMLKVPAANSTYIKELSEKYDLYLLSDISDIHWKAFKEMNFANGVDIEACFTKLYLSYQLGMTKPNPDIYEHVISDSGIVPAETIYIDDNAGNIAAGQNAGLQTILAEKNIADSYKNLLDDLFSIARYV